MTGDVRKSRWSVGERRVNLPPDCWRLRWAGCGELGWRAHQMRSWYSDFPGASGKSNLVCASCIILPSCGHWQKFASKSLHPTGPLPYPEGLSWGTLSQTHWGAWGPAEKLETAGCGPGSLQRPLLHSPPAHLTAAAVPAQPANSKASKTNRIPTHPAPQTPKSPEHSSLTMARTLPPCILFILHPFPSPFPAYVHAWQFPCLSRQ